MEGNVGIGSTSPSTKLSVVGDAYVGGNLTATGIATIGSLNGPLQANNGVVSATTSIGVLYGGTGLTSAPGANQLLLGTGSGYSLVATSSLGITSSQWTTNGTAIYYNGGNVGIGTTTSPTANFSIGNAGSANQPYVNIDGGVSTLSGGNPAQLIRIKAPNANQVAGTNGGAVNIIGGTGSNLNLGTGGDVSILGGIGGGGARNGYVLLNSTQGGNVGIGTSSPGTLFSIGNTGGINFSTATSTWFTSGGINITNGCYAVNGKCAIAANGTIITNGGTPSITSCGSSPAPTVSGNDTAGTVNIGGGTPTSCTVTFSTPRPSRPRTGPVATSVGVFGYPSSIQTTSVTYTFTGSVGGAEFDYLIVQ